MALLVFYLLGRMSFVLRSHVLWASLVQSVQRDTSDAHPIVLLYMRETHRVQGITTSYFFQHNRDRWNKETKDDHPKCQFLPQTLIPSCFCMRETDRVQGMTPQISFSMEQGDEGRPPKVSILTHNQLQQQQKQDEGPILDEVDLKEVKSTDMEGTYVEEYK